jgi:sarcosine oxidase subunit delta
MLRLHCPICGVRPETEFQCTGEAIPRAADPTALSAGAWADGLYNRNNTAGWHSFGCRQWLLVERNTLDHQIRAVRRPSDFWPSDAHESDLQESKSRESDAHESNAHESNAHESGAER